MVWPISDARIAADAPGSHDLFFDLREKLVAVVADQSAIIAQAGCPPLPNGSFEIDAPATVNPTGWTFTPHTGGSGQVTNSDASHGAQCYSVNHPSGAGKGGGILLQTDLLAIGMGQGFEIYFDTKASFASVSCVLYVKWFDKDGVQISTDQVLWQQTNSYPTSWKTFSVECSPNLGFATYPRFMQLYFDIGENTVDPGITTDILLDGMFLTFRRQFSRFQSFIVSGTFTVPAGVSRVKVILVGAGAWPTVFGNPPGGGGAYCEGFADVYPGQAVPLVVGQTSSGLPGGSSTFLGLTAGGGLVAGLAGGTASGGYLNLSGNNGGHPTSNRGGWSGMGYFSGFGWGRSANNAPGNGLVVVFY